MDDEPSKIKLQRAVDLSFQSTLKLKRREIFLSLLSFSFIAGQPVFSQVPGSGKGYIDEIARKGLTRWNKQPICFYIESNSTVPGFKPEFTQSVLDAFKIWQTAARGKLAFRQVARAQDAQIVCSWTNDKKVLMNPNEGGNTQVVPTANGLLSANMILLTMPPPGASEMDLAYLTRVALHEIGHAIGITGHSSERGDVMYSTVYSGDKATLSANDIATIIYLYSLSQSTIASRPINFAGNKLDEVSMKNASPQVRCLQLNNEAAKALQENKLDIALTKLEEAHKLDPNNQLVNSNLGSIYSNFATLAFMKGKVPESVNIYKKAVGFLENSNNKVALAQVLGNYVKVLQMANMQDELSAAKEKLAKLTGSSR